MAILNRPRPGWSQKKLLLAFLISITIIGIFLVNNNWNGKLTGSGKDLRVVSPRVSNAVQPVEYATVPLPSYTELSTSLRKRNALPPRNQDLFPSLAKDHIIIVLYVHNRPQYLKVVVDGLLHIEGINETLLIVSHDGFYEEMNTIIESIRFCQVKQLFAAFSPHLYPDSFPGTSPNDCKGKQDPVTTGCRGQADQYGNHRSPKIVSLKHHWWWMMNTVWDGLLETRGYNRHIVFIEEDHYLYPNAYRNLQMLVRIKGEKCPECWAVNLAPQDIRNRGERGEFLIAERIGNMGYAFNRTMWEKLHKSTHKFCTFDDYNWDITLWAAVYPSWNERTYTLRGPRASAIHFGKCGLHQGQRDGQPGCTDYTRELPQNDPVDQVMNINPTWSVQQRSHSGYPTQFTGWGGWGDPRDQQLCTAFASMYRTTNLVRQ